LSALTSGKVQAADVFTTTPQIVSDKLVSLTDPKNLFAAQNVIPLVYKPALTPTITSTLNAVSAKLTTAALLQLDIKVINDKESYTSAAQAWLQSVGLG
jgi:osmoprotectant transport system substrate-binding protein